MIIKMLEQYSKLDKATYTPTIFDESGVELWRRNAMQCLPCAYYLANNKLLELMGEQVESVEDTAEDI